MGRRCCCGDRGCTILNDDWSGGTSNWTVVSGTWSRLENGGKDGLTDAIQETTGTGVIVTVKQHPVEDPSSVVFLWVKVVEDLHIRIVVDADENGDGPYCEFILTGYSGVLWAGGNATAAASTYTNGNWVFLRVCYTGIEDDKAQIELSEWESREGDYLKHSEGCELPTDSDSWRVAIHNYTGATLTVGEFDWEEHYLTNPICECCFCSCAHKCLDDVLTLTYTATGQCEAEFDGDTVTLTRSGTNRSIWEGPAGDVPLYGAGGTEYFELRCQAEAGEGPCDFAEPDAWELYVIGSTSCMADAGFSDWEDLGGDETRKIASSVTCDPLSITFSADCPQSAEECQACDLNPDGVSCVSLAVTEAA